MKTKMMNWLVLLLTAGFMLTVACKGPAGPAGPKGEQGNANVKCTEWIAFNKEAAWEKYRNDFYYFKHDNDKFNFSASTIKQISEGEYITICYVKNGALRWALPASIADNNCTEFGKGRKIMNYVLHTPEDANSFVFEINVTSTDGSEVKGSDGDGAWMYRLVFIAADGGSMPTKSASADALKEELQKLSYEEVCARYDIEP